MCVVDQEACILVLLRIRHGLLYTRDVCMLVAVSAATHCIQAESWSMVVF
jgi:hypothetical protein